MRRQGARCLKKPGSMAPKAAIACSLPMRSRSCAQLPPQRAQAYPPRRRRFAPAELMQRRQLRAVRRVQRRIEHRLPHMFGLRRLLARLVMQRIKPGYRSHDPALFRPVYGPAYANTGKNGVEVPEVGIKKRKSVSPTAARVILRLTARSASDRIAASPLFLIDGFPH